MTLNKPAGLIDGDVLIFLIRTQGVIPSSQDFSMPVGWARTVPPQGSGDRGQAIVYKPIPSAAGESATSYTFGNFGSGRWIAEPIILHGTDPDNVIGGGVSYSVDDPSAYTTDDLPYLIISMWADERTSGRSHVPASTPSGYTQIASYQTGGSAAGTTGSRTAYCAGAKSVSESGSTAVASSALTWPVGTSGPRSLSTAFMGLRSELQAGVPYENANGDVVYVRNLNAVGDLVSPANIKVWYPGFDSVTDFLSKPGATVGHRGSSDVYPEASEWGYDHAVQSGYGALEFSCGFTSDMVPFGLADQYLDRVAGVSGSVDPLSMTWATLQSTYHNVLRPVTSGATQPFYSLEDFLQKFSSQSVLLVDPKFGFNDLTRLTAMLDLCDANGGPGKIIIKFDSPTPGTLLNTEAHARGYLTMNYWGGIANSAAMASQQATWDIIGALYSDAAMMAQAATYGKPVWGAVAPQQVDYNTAVTNGADFVMCSNVLRIAPVSSWN